MSNDIQPEPRQAPFILKSFRLQHCHGRLRLRWLIRSHSVPQAGQCHHMVRCQGEVGALLSASSRFRFRLVRDADISNARRSSLSETLECSSAPTATPSTELVFTSFRSKLPGLKAAKAPCLVRHPAQRCGFRSHNRQRHVRKRRVDCS